MLIIERHQTDPYFNLAAEEYFLKNFDENIVMLWQNEPSIIIGKHQNALKEINPRLFECHEVPIIRRISGGGTVYHDLGNLNFTFINSGQRDKLISFETYTEPILAALKQLGVEAHLGNHHSLMIKDKKISGNAAHVFKNRVVHHGTLLFNSDLDRLNDLISGSEKHYTDKAVKSRRMTVTNIKDYLKEDIDVKKFKEILEKFLQKQFSGIKYQMSDKDFNAIQLLANEKYKTWDWNFAYSPPFTYKKMVSVDGISYDIEIRVKKARIERLQININNKEEVVILQNKLEEKMLQDYTNHNLQYIKRLILLYHELLSEEVVHELLP